MGRWPAVQHLSFPVRDPRASERFYRDFLGFASLRAADDHIAELAMGATKLVLLTAKGEGTPQSDAHFGFSEPSRANVDEWGAKARAAGVAVESGPAAAYWGGYVLYLRDPDGYLIEIWTDA